MNHGHLTLTETTTHSPLKVYADATSTEKVALAVAGWVFCDHNDKILDTHFEQLGENIESCQAEAEALRRAIDALALLSDVQHVTLHTDCEPAIARVDCHDLRHEFEHLSIKWIPREKNQIADMVADTGLRRGATHTPTANRASYGVTD